MERCMHNSFLNIKTLCGKFVYNLNVGNKYDDE